MSGKLQIHINYRLLSNPRNARWLYRAMWGMLWFFENNHFDGVEDLNFARLWSKPSFFYLTLLLLLLFIISDSEYRTHYFKRTPVLQATLICCSCLVFA